MRKIKFLVVALVVMFGFMFTARAAEVAPERTTVGGKDYFFANGVAITIEEPTTAGMGALIKWDGGSEEVPATITVFGGRHNSTEVHNANVVMNGGTVKNIFGGGLHRSSLNEVNITVNGGTITGAIMGGGYEELVNCGDGDFNIVTEEDVLDSTTRVEKVNIVINDGHVGSVYGGGGAHAYTGTVSIVINKTQNEIAYVIGGGSNGHTGSADVVINGGKVAVLQGVNRGTMNSVEMEITGGEVENAYVGGEPDPSVTGTIEEGKIEITGGAVENLAPGTNGVEEGQAVSAKDEIVVKYNKDAVANVDETEFNEDALTKTVTLTFVVDGEEYALEHEVGTPFTEEEVEELIEEINEITKENNKEVEDFFGDADYNAIFDMLEDLNEGKTIYVQLKEVAEEGTKNPETSDIGLVGVIFTLLLSVAGLGYTIKRRKFN